MKSSQNSILRLALLPLLATALTVTLLAGCATRPPQGISQHPVPTKPSSTLVNPSSDSSPDNASPTVALSEPPTTTNHAPASPPTLPQSADTPATPATEPGTSNTPISTADTKDTRKGAELDTPFTVNGIIVISPKHPVSKRYLPKMVKPNGLTAATQTAIEKLTKAAKADGLSVKVRSGYRSYAEQDRILKRKIVEYGDEVKARRYNAEPGKSEHQSGLSVDLWDGKTWGDAIAGTKLGKWLWKHAREYGFILRYPPGKDKEKITGYIYEAWHFRYIGEKDSMQFPPNSDLTLEEYLGID